MSRKTCSPLVLGDGASSAAFSGPFRKNLKDFFRLHGEKVSFAQMKHSWAHMVQVKYKAQDGSSTDLKLHFYTELVSPEYNNVVCDECRIMGWQNHAVDVKRVHVILPSEKTLGNPRTLMSLMEMRHRGWMHRARLDASKIQREKEEDYGDGTSEFVAAENMFYSKSHLLHGVFHMNGYGHLCRVNGREGGSSMYSGTELMRVWDELCSVLRTRMISVEDVSNKLTMELRILLPLSYGSTWYGRWGYEFGRSPFNVQAKEWNSAVKSAASVRIADLIDACCQISNGQMKPRRGWKAVLAVLQRYHNAPLLSHKTSKAGTDQQRTEEASDCQQDDKVVTIGDLLKAMMDAFRSPSEAWFKLLVAKGSAGQRPQEEQAPELKGTQIKETALLAAFHAQGAPPVLPEIVDDDVYLPEPTPAKAAKKKKSVAKNGSAPALKAEGKRTKPSAPPEPQGKRSRSASGEVQPKRAKKTASAETAQMKKAPVLKIRKRPRSATAVQEPTAQPASFPRLQARVDKTTSSDPVMAAVSQPVTSTAVDMQIPVASSIGTQAAVTAPLAFSQPLPTELPGTSLPPAKKSQLSNAVELEKFESGDLRPLKKHARTTPQGDSEDITPPTLALIATDAFAHPSSFEESKDDHLGIEGGGVTIDMMYAGDFAPSLLDCMTDQGGRSKRSRQPSVRLARFHYEDKDDKPRRNGVSSRQSYDDDTWMPSTSTNGLNEALNRCDITAATDRKPVRRRTPSAKAELASGQIHENSDVLMCSDEAPLATIKVAGTRSPAKAKAGKQPVDEKLIQSLTEGKPFEAKVTKSPAGKSQVSRSPVGKSAVSKSPISKSPAGKAAAGKVPVGKSTLGSPAGKSTAKGRGRKSPAYESDSFEKQCLESASVLSTVGAVSSATPSSNAENAPSDAMKLWCRNVDRLSPDVSENINVHYSLLPNITAWSGANMTKPPPPATHAAVAQLRDALATLRYTKHFVKDYQGELPAAGRPVKAYQPRAGKKKGAAAASAEVRILVTVLMGYSFDTFGGPDAPEEEAEKGVNGFEEGVHKQTRPRSHRTRCIADTGDLPTETASTQAADTDDAEVGLRPLRTCSTISDVLQAETGLKTMGTSSTFFDAVQGDREPDADAECDDPGNTGGPGGVLDACTAFQHDPGDLAKEAAAVRPAGDNSEVPICRHEVHAPTEGNAVPGQSLQDVVMSFNAGDTVAAQEVTPAQIDARAQSINDEESQDRAENTTAIADEHDADIFVAQRQDGAHGATDTTCREHTEAMTSTVAMATCPVHSEQPGKCDNSVENNGVEERHNSSEPADSGQHTAVKDAHIECKQEEFQDMGDTGVKEQPCCAAVSCDDKVQTVGDAPGFRQGLGDSPAAIDFGQMEELRLATHDPSALPPLLRPPPAELITCQPSTTVGDLRRQIAAAFKETYQIFSKFRVDWLHCPQLFNTCASEENSTNPFVLGKQPPEKGKIEQFLPLSATEPVHIIAAGPGLDLNNKKLRHAGGEADWEVACHCGVTDDDGERMLCCDKCGRWVHSYCEGIADSQPDPTKFTCRQCLKPRGSA